MPQQTAEARLSATSHRGTLAVISMLALALAMAAFAWFYNYSHSQRVLALYGAEAVTLIRTAPQVEILSEQPSGDIDISHAPGLLHARTSLIAEASYLWNANAADFPSTPTASIRFRRGDRSVTIDFDFANRSVRPSSTNTAAQLIDKTASGWQAFIERNRRSPEQRIPTP